MSALVEASEAVLNRDMAQPPAVWRDLLSEAVRGAHVNTLRAYCLIALIVKTQYNGELTQQAVCDLRAISRMERSMLYTAKRIGEYLLLNVYRVQSNAVGLGELARYSLPRETALAVLECDVGKVDLLTRFEPECLTHVLDALLRVYNTKPGHEPVTRIADVPRDFLRAYVAQFGVGPPSGQEDIADVRKPGKPAVRISQLAAAIHRMTEEDVEAACGKVSRGRDVLDAGDRLIRVAVAGLGKRDTLLPQEWQSWAERFTELAAFARERAGQAQGPEQHTAKELEDEQEQEVISAAEQSLEVAVSGQTCRGGVAP